MNLFKKADVIIFDLDGTLYEDTEHFSYFAQLLKEEVEPANREAYEREYKRIEAGEHIVTIGKVYDATRDYVLEVDPIRLEVKNGWTWEGLPLQASQLAELYPQPITFDFESLIAIGDGWWLPNTCAKHYGVADTYPSYTKTKEYMASDQFTLKRIEQLREGLEHLKARNKTLLLMTNSQQDDVERLLSELQLSDLFSHQIIEAAKPQKTLEHFEAILKNYQVAPQNCLSIGDNYINEIAPAMKLGMQSIFIDMYGLDYAEYVGVKVQSISEVIPSMKQV